MEVGFIICSRKIFQYWQKGRGAERRCYRSKGPCFFGSHWMNDPVKQAFLSLWKDDLAVSRKSPLTFSKEPVLFRETWPLSFSKQPGLLFLGEILPYYFERANKWAGFFVLFERIVYYRIVWSWIWGIFPVYSFGIFRGSLAEWHKGRLERGSCCSSKSDFQGKYNWKYCLSHVMNPQWEKRRAKFI